jgi:hypothetical protein
MRYFVLDGGPARGPYDLEQIRQRLSIGKISCEAMACAEGDTKWQPLAPILDAADDDSEDVRTLFKPSPLRAGGADRRDPPEDEATRMLQRVEPPSSADVDEAAALAQAVSDARRRIASESASSPALPRGTLEPQSNAPRAAEAWRPPPIPVNTRAAAPASATPQASGSLFRKATCPTCKREVPVPADAEEAWCSYCAGAIRRPGVPVDAVKAAWSTLPLAVRAPQIGAVVLGLVVIVGGLGWGLGRCGTGSTADDGPSAAASSAKAKGASKKAASSLGGAASAPSADVPVPPNPEIIAKGLVNPVSLVASDGAVFVSTHGKPASKDEAAGLVVAVADDAAFVKVLATGQKFPSMLARDADSLYWATLDRSVSTVPTVGGASRVHGGAHSAAPC